MSEWIEGRYATWRRTLDGGTRLSVSWDNTRPKGSDDPPYVACVGDKRLKQRFNTFEVAVAKAESVALRCMQKGIADLCATSSEEENP